MPENAGNPYEHVERIEQALALALRVPRFPAPPAKGKRKIPPPGEIEDLSKFLAKEGSTLRGYRVQYLRPGEPGDLNDLFALQPGSWGGTEFHFGQRHRLIGMLIEIRELMLEGLRRLPVPGKDGHWVYEAPRSVIRDVPAWGKLSERQQKFLAALARKDRMTSKEISKPMKISPDAARKVASDLGRMGIIETVARDGYVIVRTPLNAPQGIRAVTDPHAVTP